MNRNFISDYFMRKSPIYLFLFIAAIFILLYMILDIASDFLLIRQHIVAETIEKFIVSVLFILCAVVTYFFSRRYVDCTADNEKLKSNYYRYIENSPDALFVTDGSGVISMVNPASVNTTGYPEEELIGMNLHSLWAMESVSAGYEALASLAQNGTLRTTLKFTAKNSGTFFMSVSSVKISDAEYIHMCRDVTESVQERNRAASLNLELRHKMESELETARKREFLLESTKKYADMGMMLTAISHHWRQPLNSLGLFIQDICDSYRGGVLTEQYMDEFESASRGLITELSDTIDNFRLFFSPANPVREISVLKELLNILKIISAQISYLNINVRVKCGCEKQNYDCKNIFICPDCEYKNTNVYGDIGKFRHAMLNLIYNAMDAVGGSKQKKGEIVVSVRCEEDSISVDIEDNGAGFSKSILKKPFEPYKSSKSGGTGIGLFMARVVFCDHFSGRMELDNTKTGAHVHIVLPRYHSIIQGS